MGPPARYISAPSEQRDLINLIPAFALGKFLSGTTNKTVQ